MAKRKTITLPARRVEFAIIDGYLDWLDNMAYVLDISSNELINLLIERTYHGKTLFGGLDLSKLNDKQLDWLRVNWLETRDGKSA